VRQGKLINGQASNHRADKAGIGDSVVSRECTRSVVATLPFRSLLQQVHPVSRTCERQRSDQFMLLHFDRYTELYEHRDRA